jgi:hypothetical protein
MASLHIQLSLLWIALLAVTYWNMAIIIPIMGMLLLVLVDTYFVAVYVSEPLARRITGVATSLDVVCCDISFISSVLTATASGFLLGADEAPGASEGEDWRMAFAVRALLVANVITVESIMSQWPRLRRNTRLRTAAFTVATLVVALLCWAFFATVVIDREKRAADGLCSTVLAVSCATLVLRLLKTLVKMCVAATGSLWGAASGVEDFDPRDGLGLRMDLVEAVLAFLVSITYAPSGNLPWLLQFVLLQRLYRLVTCTNNCRRYDEIVRPFPVVHGITGDCIICLDAFNEPAGCRKLHCGHHFHDVCLRKWLMQSSRCPTCRQNVFATPARQDGDSDQTREIVRDNITRQQQLTNQMLEEQQELDRRIEECREIHQRLVAELELRRELRSGLGGRRGSRAQPRLAHETLQVPRLALAAHSSLSVDHATQTCDSLHAGDGVVVSKRDREEGKQHDPEPPRQKRRADRK